MPETPKFALNPPFQWQNAEDWVNLGWVWGSELDGHFPLERMAFGRVLARARGVSEKARRQ